MSFVKYDKRWISLLVYAFLLSFNPFTIPLLGKTIASTGVDWTLIEDDSNVGSLTDDYQVKEEAALRRELGCLSDVPIAAETESWNWHLLPDGLLWRSYLAGPHEPRISMVIFRNSDDEWFWDAVIGGRVGLLRYGTSGSNRPQGWQWDLEGAVMTRLDLQNSEDVESMDYRFGTDITAAEGPWGMRLGYYHISSHVGDEYIERNPLFERINYVTESFVIALSYSPTASTRYYGEFANSFRTSGGARRYQYQTGFEYTPIAKVPSRGAPYAAINVHLREAVDYDAATTLQVGWGWQGQSSGRRLRVGLQYGQGPTSQYEFFQRREEYLGCGVWFDY